MPPLTNILKILLAVIIKLFALWFSLTVFSTYTKLADADSYVAGEWVSKVWFDRTYSVGNISYFLASNLGKNWAYIVFALVSGLGIAITMIRMPSAAFWRIGPLFFLPSTTIYTSIPGKESLAGFGICLILAWWFSFLENKKTILTLTVLPLGLFIYAFLRPHYALAVCYIVFLTLIWRPVFKVSNKIINFYCMNRLSFGVVFLVITMTVAFSLPNFFDLMSNLIKVALSYFPAGNGRADRHAWLSWTVEEDFWTNLWWSLPFSIIGPLPNEVVERPIFLPFALEGMFILALILFALIRLVKCGNLQKQKYTLTVIVPGLLLLVMLHAPFGTANPGSAIRYRAAFEWILLIPLVFLAFDEKSSRSFFQHPAERDK